MVWVFILCVHQLVTIAGSLLFKMESHECSNKDGTLTMRACPYLTIVSVSLKFFKFNKMLGRSLHIQ